MKKGKILRRGRCGRRDRKHRNSAQPAADLLQKVLPPSLPIRIRMNHLGNPLSLPFPPGEEMIISPLHLKQRICAIAHGLWLQPAGLEAYSASAHEFDHHRGEEFPPPVHESKHAMEGRFLHGDLPELSLLDLPLNSQPR